ERTRTRAVEDDTTNEANVAVMIGSDAGPRADDTCALHAPNLPARGEVFEVGDDYAERSVPLHLVVDLLQCVGRCQAVVVTEQKAVFPSGESDAGPEIPVIARVPLLLAINEGEAARR